MENIKEREYEKKLKQSTGIAREQVFGIIIKDYTLRFQNSSSKPGSYCRSLILRLDDSFRKFARKFPITDDEGVNEGLFINHIYIAVGNPYLARDFAREFRLPYDPELAIACKEYLEDIGLVKPKDQDFSSQSVFSQIFKPPKQDLLNSFNMSALSKI